MTGPSLPEQHAPDNRRGSARSSGASPAVGHPPERSQIAGQPFNREARAKKALSRTIIGQTDSVALLLTLGQQHRLDAGQRPAERPANRNVMLIGSAGSGKTCIPKAVCAELNIPLAVVDATDFAPPGSRLGRSLDEVFAEMLKAAGHQLRNAERGALLLEDLDKLALSLSPDVSQHMQQAWLRFLDGRSGTVAHAHGTGLLSSERWWVIATGTFDGLEQAQARRASGGGIGFNNVRVAAEPQAILPADLISCGITTALVGRFPFLCRLATPTVDELVAVTRLQTSAVGQWIREFRQAGIELIVTEDARRDLANQASALNLGARGIGVVLSSRLTCLMACLPELRGRTRRVIIRSEHLKTGDLPEIVLGQPQYPVRDHLPERPPGPDDALPPELAKQFPPALMPKRPARVATGDGGGSRLATLADLGPFLEKNA